MPNGKRPKQEPFISESRPWWQSVMWEIVSRTTRFGERQREDLRTVCLIVGPYRNLTSLTSVLLFLHPNCQVLNHAGERVFGNRRMNFLLDYTVEKFDRFCQFALFASKKGRRGSYGGSIALSRAFRRGSVTETYRNRYGDGKVTKDTVHSIVWKESLRTINFLREVGTDLSHFLSENDKLRFLMPVRNPLDCAISNFKTGHAKLFSDLKSYTVESILDCVLRELLWFIRLQQAHPERCYYFFQDDLLEGSLFKELAQFLDLSPDERWLRDARQCAVLERSYSYRSEWIVAYQERIHFLFSGYPELLKRLESFGHFDRVSNNKGNKGTVPLLN